MTASFFIVGDAPDVEPFEARLTKDGFVNKRRSDYTGGSPLPLSESERMQSLGWLVADLHAANVVWIQFKSTNPLTAFALGYFASQSWRPIISLGSEHDVFRDHPICNVGIEAPRHEDAYQLVLQRLRAVVQEDS